MKPDRQTLLVMLGNERKRLPWHTLSAVGVSICLALFLFVFGLPIVALIAKANVGAAAGGLLGFSLLIGLGGGFAIYRKNRHLAIEFDSDGFSVTNGPCVFWADVEKITPFRQTLTVTKINGSVEKITLPEVKASRDDSHFSAILKTFEPDDMRKVRVRRICSISGILGIMGVVSAAMMGRPKLLIWPENWTATTLDYVHLAAWCTGLILGFGLFLGLILLLELATVSKANPEPIHEPETDPFLARIESNFGWLELMELEPGKRYRYCDSERLGRDLRTQANAMWVSVAFITIIMLVLACLPLAAPPAWLVLVAVCLPCTIFPIQYLLRLRRCRSQLSDTISIIDKELVIDREGQEHRFSCVKSKLFGETVRLQTTWGPFASFERYGVKPNTYEIDRRFLVEVKDNE